MSAYRKIMVAVDGSATAARGLREAIRLANAERAELCLLHVVNERVAFAPLTGAAPLDLTPTLREAGRQVLAAAKARAAKQGVRAKTVLSESIDRTAARSIVSEARRHQASPTSTIGIGLILRVCARVSVSNSSSNVPKPPGKATIARARSKKCSLRSAKYRKWSESPGVV